MAGLLDCLYSCDLESLENLFKKLDVNRAIPNTEGCTALHVLAGIDTVNSKEKILNFLLENGADPNARSYENLTPVHIAAMWNKCYELEKLLQHGGDPWLTDYENKNCFSMAADNHCYEALQLLHIYLAEGKLNCKPQRNPSNELKPASPASLNISKTFGDVERDVNASMNYTYMTANECFPLLFSSSDESGDHLSDVSKFLKMKHTSSPKDKVSLAEENSFSDTSSSVQDGNRDKINTNVLNDEAKKQKKVNFSNYFNKAYFLSSSDYDYDTSEILSSDLADSNDDSTYGTIIDSDDSSGISLLEMKIDSKLYSNVSVCAEGSDWKSYQSINNCSTKTYCSSHSKLSIIIPDEFHEYSNSKIFEELQNMGDNPGPVLDHTRQVYLQRLVKLKSGCITCCELPKPKYCPELYLFLENKMDLERAQFLERNIAEEFDAESDKKWREGNQKCCFNYFLLDPRVTQNLPQRASQLTNEEAFLTFLDALFYVGKGTKGRPFSHLFEAAKSTEEGHKKSDKVNHILDIWNAGLGVISLHCFHNSIPVEAYTREACILEAVGLKNLTNIKKGDFYGLCTRLTPSRKRLIGISLLHKAFQIFLLDGPACHKSYATGMNR